MGGSQGSRSGEVLSSRVKSVFALGDHTLNLTLSALSLFYLCYLSDSVGLRPSLASGLVERWFDQPTWLIPFGNRCESQLFPG